MSKRQIHIQIQMPVSDDNKLIVAASIAQTAAALYAANSAMTEEDAVTWAFELYANVVERLQEAVQI
jgi:hypothetical protein